MKRLFFSAILLMSLLISIHLPQASAEVTKPWTISAAAQTSSSLYVFGTSERTLQTDLDLSGKYRLSDQFSTALKLGATQELVGEKRFILNDGSIALTYRGWQPLSEVKLDTRLKATVPLSIQSHDRDSLITALALQEGLSYEIKKTGLGISGGLAVMRAFHQFDTATTGRSELQHQFKAILGLSFSPIEAVTMSLDGSRSASWTYQGHLLNRFGISQEFTFLLAKGVNATVGHSNGGDVLKVNGQDSNVSLVSDTGSNVYAGLSYVF
ncbi:MAG: hypothetical protein AABZ55_03830 [Bdellovibrionota bacterium]